MPETDTSTRQRLLNLWEKCPECKPTELQWQDKSWGHQWYISGHWGSDPVVFALARDAIVRWLVMKTPDEPLQLCWSGGDFWLQYGDDIALDDQDTLIDALISAVEAVLDADKEKQG